jgi:hypothetical protein
MIWLAARLKKRPKGLDFPAGLCVRLVHLGKERIQAAAVSMSPAFESGVLAMSGDS